MAKKKNPKSKINFITLLLFILGTLLVGFIGSSFTLPSISTWYATLKKSALNPPNWIFGPVWTTLYILMAVAAWQISGLKPSFRTKKALVFFVLQLILNVLWSYLFFGKQLLLAAFIEILILWLFILITTIKFYKLKPSAGWLFVPYLAWVSFASYLTFAAWTLNR